MSRTPCMKMRRAAVTVLLPLGILIAGAPLAAQETAEVAGAVLDSTTHKPLPFANVALLETGLGANTQMDGSYRVPAVPAGTYQVRASFIGYEPQVRSCTVAAGQTVRLRFALIKKGTAGTTKKIVVLDTRPLVNVSEISTVRQTQAEDIRKMTVDNVVDVVERSVGVSGGDQEVHVRGGRSDETVFRIESVAMKNVVTGAPVGGTMSAKAVQEIQVITGGYQAEHGQAISGVVDVELKEAGEQRRSSVEYTSGSFNTQRIFLQTEGREPITGDLLPHLGLHVPGKVGLLIGVDLLATDTYLPSRRFANDPDLGQRRTLRSRYAASLLGLQFNYDDFMRWRQKNGLNGYAKLTWRATQRHKVNLTLTKFVSIDHGFSSFRLGDEVADASTARASYPWAFAGDQDHPGNLDQYPTYIEETNSQILSWKYAVSNQAFTSVALSHFFNNVTQAVQGKMWWQYDEWRPTGRNQFFITDDNGDYPFFQDLYVDRWSLNANLTKRWHGHHEFKAGAEGNYYSLQMLEIRNPREGPVLADGTPTGLGSVRDMYHVYPNDGSFYAQNQFKYEGFVGHVGMRADYLFLGRAADNAVWARQNGMSEAVAQDYLNDTNALFGRRYKLFWSPRLGINHPITDRDEMHFNFGHFIQWPRLIYYYAKLSSRSSEAFPVVGNLDLDPQRSVQFEFGVKHQFTDHDAADITFFNKDVYDYPTATRPIEATAKRLVYINDDFSRTRGLEIEARHRRSRRWSGSLSYEYQIATGKPADPNRIKQVDPDALETGDAEPELTEQFMPWNRPHRMQANFDYRFAKGDHAKIGGLQLPDRCGVSLYYTLGSGRPYTPTDTRGQRTGKPNSKNAPFEHGLDAKLDKFWELRGGARFGISFEVRNLMDTRVLRTVDSNTGEAPRLGSGRYTTIGSDVSRDVVRARLANPSFYGEPRNLRLGLEVTF